MPTQNPTGQTVVRVKSPEELEVERLLTEIEQRKATVADLELEIETFKVELGQFEARYHVTVGGLYAELDRLQIRIDECYWRIERIRQGEREEDEERQRVFRERQAQAEEYERRAHAAEAQQAAQPKVSAEEERALKELYRRLAKTFHPDVANTEEERRRNERLMTEINEIYAQRNLERLRRIVERERPTEEPAETIGEKLVRLIRQRHALDQAIAALQRELEKLKASDTYKLKAECDHAAQEGRDLLAEIAARLQAQIRQKEEELRHTEQELERAMRSD